MVRVSAKDRTGTVTRSSVRSMPAKLSQVPGDFPFAERMEARNEGESGADRRLPGNQELRSGAQGAKTAPAGAAAVWTEGDQQQRPFPYPISRLADIHGTAMRAAE